MNKTEFVEAINTKTGISKKDCKLCLDSILEVIKDVLKRGGSLTLSNFGKFKINETKPKQMYCFKTGKTEILGSRKIMTFKASENLKQSIK